MRFFLRVVLYSLLPSLVIPTLALGRERVRLFSSLLENAPELSSPPFIRHRLDLYQLESGWGYEVFEPKRAWGTWNTVSTLQDVLQGMHQEFPDAPSVLVQDLSRRGGGILLPHLSHRRGRDVDIRLMMKRSSNPFADITASNLDRARLWYLIEALARSNAVQVIYLDYQRQRLLYRYAKGLGIGKERLAEIFQFPRGPKSWVGMVRHWPGHADHLHVTFHRDPRPMEGEKPVQAKKEREVKRVPSQS
jgi:murein endopeptidase